MSRVLAMRLLITMSCALLPVVAYAADGEDHGGTGSIHADVIQVDPVILIFAVVVFLAVMFFLKGKAWGPLLAALEERERKIEASREAAEKASAEAERVSQEHETVLAEARSEASAIVDKGKRKAEEIAAEIRDKAKIEADSLKRAALAEIATAHKNAVDEIHQRSVELALQISQKLTGKSVNADEHRAVIDEAIKRQESVAS